VTQKKVSLEPFAEKEVPRLGGRFLLFGGREAKNRAKETKGRGGLRADISDATQKRKRGKTSLLSTSEGGGAARAVLQKREKKEKNLWDGRPAYLLPHERCLCRAGGK